MLKAIPMTRDQANEWIVRYHRHHGRIYGHRFIVGAERNGKTVGVIIGGRPRARLIDQYHYLEITRLCTDGSKNVCSFLYSKAARITREMGFDGCFTSILESESGTSLKASGWVFAYMTKGGTQDRPSRRRNKVHPECPKQIWCPSWCINLVKNLNKTQASIS